MDWSKTAAFGAIKQRMEWLDQRQEVLARNIANADTPGFVPKDLEPFRFADAMGKAAAPVTLATSDQRHLSGTRPRQSMWAERAEENPVEALPNGNAVDLEAEMAKLNETGTSHRLATQLYRKYLGMVRTAASARG